MDPNEAAALLEELADRALRSEFEPVACLEAPEPAEVPASLRRADGRSVYQRHGGVRYATRAQLGMEERMLAQAFAGGAPRLARAAAAHALGADLARLEDALEGRAPGAHDDARDAQPLEQTTGSGLRVDQAAAAMAVLTDGRRVSVINAPAGSGKTWVLAALGRAWQEAGFGRVIGVTPSQSARNTLAAGVAECYNSAQFLGHLPGQRGARGPVAAGPGPLLLVDESSMVPGLDLADLVAYAEAHDGKLVLAGDLAQLQAVENGGGMALLAGKLGYVQLTEPVRFKAAWERAASLRLRDGDASVLADYDQRARIRGGDPEQMMDAAATAYVALTVAGTDTLLMAADHALRKELSRRIRDDLIRLGLIQPGPAVSIADGAQASVGDLIICTRNDHATEAGERGRTLANGDLLRIEAITPDGLLVRRALDADPKTGKRRWTGRQFLFARYEDAELGYAVAVLNAIWAAETTPARHQRYRDLYLAALPPGYQQEPGHQARWLWRTLRAAELAGLDPAEALANAVGERDLVGARDIPSVIDARLRRHVGTLVPLSGGTWSQQVPEIEDPERRAFAAQIAVMMDERKERIGEHAARHALPWAVAPLGPVPGDQPGRLQWQRRAASIGAWRELSGYAHPRDPIGPEPVTGTPELRAAWHEALAALGPGEGTGVRGMPDGMLLHLRDTYPIETAWAPAWTGDELRQARAGAWDARLATLRATAEATAARRQGHREEAARQRNLAASYQALHDAYRQREDALAAAMADRAAWEQATRARRQLAIAADAELRRRHPGQHHPLLRSAEPEPSAPAPREEPALTTEADLARMDEIITSLTAQRRELARHTERTPQPPPA